MLECVSKSNKSKAIKLIKISEKNNSLNRESEVYR